jgi:hypothetical protein
MFMQNHLPDPDIQFYLTHHMTREQMAERDREWAADRARAKALAGCDDDIPGANAKEQLTNLHAKIAREEAEKSKFTAQDARLQAAIDEPAKTLAKRDGLLKTLAKRLLGGEDAGSEGFDFLQRRTLDAEIDQAEHNADVAKLARAAITDKLEVATLRVARLRERLPGFERAAMAEHIREHLAPEYRRAIAPLRDITQRIDGARRAAGMCGLEKSVTLQTFGLLDSRDAQIAPDHAAQAPWCKLIDSWK